MAKKKVEEVKEEIVLGAIPKKVIEHMIQKLYSENKEIFDTMSSLQKGLQIEVKAAKDEVSEV